MEAILRVIQYLFNKENIPASDKIFNNFFENGISFPQFVALAFNIDEVPGFDSNPKKLFQRNKNNDIAYQYLSSKNPEIAKIAPNYHTKENQVKLLSFMLTKNIFEIEKDEILLKCNKIVQALNIHYDTIDDLANEKCLLALLSSITDGKVQYTTKHKNIDNIVKQAFKKAKVPLIIDKSSFEPENKFLFYIQIEIIFEIYPENAVHLLTPSIQNQKKRKNQEKLEEFDDDDDNDTNEMNFISDDSIGDEISKSTNPIDENINLSSSKDVPSDICGSADSFLSTNNSLDTIGDSPIKISEFYFPKRKKPELSDPKGNPSDINDSKDSFSTVNDSCDSFLTSIEQFKKRKKRMKTTFEPEKDSQYLLDIINVICKDIVIHFDNFEQAIEDDNIKKFLLHIFKNDEMISKSINQIFDQTVDLDVERLDILIQYLGTIEPKFNVLIFDFENPEFLVPSAILLYSNILNFFFLKTTKQKLFERVYTILHYKDIVRIRDFNKEFNTLSKIETFTKLQKFIQEGVKKKKDDDTSSIIIDVPLVLDKFYLDNYVKSYDIPDTVYFQLQIMFNYFDENSIILMKHHFAELFYIALRRLKKIRVPPTIQMVRSIRAKNISLILQMKRKKMYEQKTEETNKETEDEDENEEDEEKIMNDENIIDIPYLHTFLERSNQQYSIRLNEKKNKKKQIRLVKLESAETFWNPPKNNYIFRNGILFNQDMKKRGEDFWERRSKELSHKKKKKKQIKTLKPSKQVDIKVTSLSSNKFRTLGASNVGNPYFDKILRIDEDSKLYELFYYDELVNKWQFNKDEFESLKKAINAKSKTQMPLIVFFNSNEDDSMEVCYHLNKFCFPKDNEKIVIYGSCNRNLSFFNMNNNYTLESELIWPLFLFLHVPPSKHGKENISTIVFQIFSFLFFIQNVVICIFNGNQLDQISFQEELITINNSFEFKHDASIKSKNSNSNNEDDDFEEDKIDDFYDENDEKMKLFYNLNPEYFNKPFKYICLINDENIESKPGTNFFEKELDEKIRNKEVFIQSHSIDIKDPTTYGPFLKVLNEYVMTSNFFVKDIEIIFGFLPLFDMSSTYIDLKQNEEKIEENLGKMMNDRFFMLKNDSLDPAINDYTIIAKLQKEMHSTFPLFDSFYNEKCNLILSRQKELISRENIGVITTELTISSKKNLSYLSDIIKNELYWTNEQHTCIHDSHVNFLKKEFFDIIHYLFPQKVFIMIYTDNMNILNKKIEEDSKAIDNMFKEFADKVEQKTPKMKKIVKGMKTTIREKEYEREIKARIEIGGKLEDLLEQDF